MAVNFALKALQHHSECRYISITSANHAYGSEVVERVLGARPVLGQAVAKQPDILLAPMDSKYFAAQGKWLAVYLYIQFFCEAVSLLSFLVPKNKIAANILFHLKSTVTIISHFYLQIMRCARKCVGTNVVLDLKLC